MAKIVIANWKMNPQTLREAEQLLRVTKRIARARKNLKVVVCPPFVWLASLSRMFGKRLELGAQDVAWAERGAFTGEISAAMLKNLKCSWVIVGHSERRSYLKEDDTMINRKVLQALNSGLKVVLAVGEQKREESRHVVGAILETQLTCALMKMKSQQLRNLVIAYEPVWAIGTGLSARPDDALQATLLIRKVIAKQFGNLGARRCKVLYGGSVDKRNVASFVNQEGIDGVLVGGASLDSKGFPELLKHI